MADIGLTIPRTITAQLKKEYPAYSVYYGKEIRAKNKNLYQVVIGNKYEYRVINCEDTDMEEIKRLKNKPGGPLYSLPYFTFLYFSSNTKSKRPVLGSE